MELARGCRAKDQINVKSSQNGGIPSNSDTLLEIKLPDARVIRVLSRSLFLVLVILTLPCVGSILSYLSSCLNYDGSAYDYGSDSTGFDYLDLLLQDLANEGLIEKGDKALIVSSGIGVVIDGSRFLNAKDIDFVLESDLEQEKFPDATFDLSFAFSFEDAKSLDRVVKVGGIVVTKMSDDLSNALQKQSNYGVVHLRRYDSTIVAMRKTSLVNELTDSSARSRLCQLALEARKMALKGLEDVLLEPPRKALAHSIKYLKRFNYLPDLMGDTLEAYPRRVFINVGVQEEKNGVMVWFAENYPTRNQDFQLYNVEWASEEVSSKGESSADVSNWLLKNVGDEEFIVMKAEADVVEELIERRTIGLVDELFLECKNQWLKEERKKSNRAYWECLSLYGRLRDEGVAVHQWWG